MQYRPVIKKTKNWWIGWLANLPGVYAQEKTKKELVKSLIIGAEDLLTARKELENKEKQQKLKEH
jgi:predicted RNase H-like HicB family nuclease